MATPAPWYRTPDAQWRPDDDCLYRDEHCETGACCRRWAAERETHRDDPLGIGWGGTSEHMPPA